MRPGRRVPRCVAVGAGLVALLSGCGLTHLQDLQFRVDKRLHFASPHSRALVRQPLTVSWSMQDFTVAAPGTATPSRAAGYFAIFVDMTPIRPGRTMKDVASGDRYCQRAPTCPDKKYLADHGVYTTTGTTFQLPLIPSLSNDRERIQLHSITIVLIDTSGHRIGESAWQLDVRIPKVGA